MSRRKEIVNYITNELKNINASTSTYDSNYTFKTNIFNNSFRMLRFIDEVNDFPSLYLTAGTEIRDFQSLGLTEGTLDITIRTYVYGNDNSYEILDNLLEDIEHVVYSISNNPQLGILDIKIDNIQTDEGLLSPYGLAEVELSVSYTLF